MTSTPAARRAARSRAARDATLPARAAWRRRHGVVGRLDPLVPLPPV